ncbi:CRP/FNR family transcriptional regulator [Melghirimyces profundicolus]|uniref:CRP/FNR family transcriptional regulator n=1 Tax=Melghirimyces profundicolus TaxID=1242148 RepID=A0A2T6C8S1_9BACL|nr:Crp/Fnr family transcriptional regulator [Melghirimyces profundicolus]PTX64717.1 CRP/FNR family transcriptional regulator [Melghirimyces profundicolus]
MNKLWYLSQINLMEELPLEDLKEIDRMAPMSKTPKGTIISSPEEPQPALYLLKKGKVRLYKLNREGKEFTLGILGDGNIFGEVETFSTGTRDTYVQAMEETLLCVLNKKDLEEFMKERPSLAIKLIGILTERLREAEEMLENLAYGSVQKRLLYLLSKLVHNFGNRKGVYWELDLRLSHQDLAAMIGATRETVSATLSELTRQGVIAKGRNKRDLRIHLEKMQSVMNRE